MSFYVHFLLYYIASDYDLSYHVVSSYVIFYHIMLPSMVKCVCSVFMLCYTALSYPAVFMMYYVVVICICLFIQSALHSNIFTVFDYITYIRIQYYHGR